MGARVEGVNAGIDNPALSRMNKGFAAIWTNVSHLKLPLVVRILTGLVRKRIAGSWERGAGSRTERGARWGAKKDQGTKGRRVKGRGWLVAGHGGRGYDTLARRLFAATRAIRPDRPSLKAWAKPILKIRLVQPNFQGFATRLTPAPSWAFVGGVSFDGRGLRRLYQLASLYFSPFASRLTQ